MIGIWQIAAAGFGTVAFSIMYNVPQHHFIDCGLCGAVAWIGYLLGGRLSEVVGVFVGAMLVVWLSNRLAVSKGCPVTVFLIPGIFPLVPGKGIYYTVYYAMNGLYSEAAGTFFNAFKYAFAIAMAISIGTLLRSARH